jgi:RNA polymerase sigma factor (sigma-70 family)
VDGAELLRAWAGGDVESGRMLFVRHAGELTDFVARKLDGDTADLVHHVFAACLDAAKSGRAIENVRAYLFRCARNEIVDRLGARARVVFDPAVASLHDAGTTPTARCAKDEERRLLHAALRRLPLDDQIALELFYFEELSGPELARVLGVPEGTARTRLRRARQDLERALVRLDAAGEGLRATTQGLEDWLSTLRDVIRNEGLNR